MTPIFELKMWRGIRLTFTLYGWLCPNPEIQVYHPKWAFDASMKMDFLSVLLDFFHAMANALVPDVFWDQYIKDGVWTPSAYHHRDELHPSTETNPRC